MDQNNPWQSPDAPLEQEPALPEKVMPFEEKGRPLFPRVWETVTLILQDAAEAGRRLGAIKTLGPAMAFFACVGLPLQWLGQIITALGMPLDQPQNEWVFRALHLPPPPPPTPEAIAMGRMMVWVTVVIAPIIMALGLLLMGLLAHLGMWMLGATKQGKGLEVTFRSVLYVTAATSWIHILTAAVLFIPGIGARMLQPLLGFGLGMGVLTFQGLVLAHAHDERPWKGILGIFLPYLILACICGGCLAGAVGMTKGLH